MLRDSVEQRGTGGDGGRQPFRLRVARRELEEPEKGMLFHDGTNRSAEQLMTDQAKNALMHNLAIELLRNQFQQLEMAIKERPT